MNETGYSTISPDPTFKLIQNSIPYCVFRNKERYYLNHTEQSSKKDVYYDANQAESQTRLYLDSIGDHSVPSHLLYGTLRREFSSKRYCDRSSSSAVSAFSHCGLNLFVHAGGRYLDQIILRDAYHCYKGRDLDKPPGFVLPLSKGSTIKQICSAGTTHWGYYSQLLARTDSELFHIKTVGLDEHIVRSDSGSESVSGDCSMNYESAPVVLEPTQKWQFPTEICSLSCSPAGWSFASILGADGSLFTWTAMDGVRSVNKSVFPTSQTTLHPVRDCTRRVDCTMHAQVLHVSCDDLVYLYDLRSNSTSVPLFTTTKKRPVQAIKQHEGLSHCMMVSAGNTAMLIDTRFPRIPIAQQYIPGGHSALSFVKSPLQHSTVSAGIFLGSSATGTSQLYAHSVECTTAPGFNARTRLEGVDYGTALNACIPAGFQSGMRWDIDGFPVVDAPGREGGDSAAAADRSLLGYAVVPVPTQTGNQRDQSKDPDGELLVDGNARDRERNDRDQHAALLVQQSFKGDIFVQKVSWMVNPYVYKPTATANNKNTTSAEVSRAASAAAIRRNKRKRLAHLRQDSDEDSSEESEDEPLAPIRLSQQGEHSSDVSQAVTVEDFVLPPPPVQLGLPCGLRAYPEQVCSSSGSTTTSTTTASSSTVPSGIATTPNNNNVTATAGIKKFLKTVIKNNGLILTNPLSSQSDTAQTSIYPAGSKQFLPFIPEDCLRGFDVIGLSLKDVHSNQPDTPVTTTKHETMKKVSLQGNDLIDFLDAVKSECLKFISKEPRTLWEIWHFLLRLPQGVYLDLAELRVQLCILYELVEAVVPMANMLTKRRDQAKVSSVGRKRVHRSRGDSDDSGSESSESQCGHQFTSSTAGIQDEIPPCLTFDGISVCSNEAEVGSKALGYFRDQSLGHEVRLGRVGPPTTALISGNWKGVPRVGKDAQSTLKIGEDPLLSLCDCKNVQLSTYTTDSASRITLCGSAACLGPHRLLYRIPTHTTADSSQPSLKSKGRAGTVIGRVKPSTESFYWGGGHPIPTIPTPSSPMVELSAQTPARPGAAGRYAAVFTPAAKSSQYASTAARTAPYTQTAIKPRHPTTTAHSALEDEEHFDVTDNMLAVLGNNWNRVAVAQAQSVDPVETSLLQSWGR